MTVHAFPSIELVCKRGDDQRDSYGLKWFVGGQVLGLWTYAAPFPKALEVLFRDAHKTMWLYNRRGTWQAKLVMLWNKLVRR